MVDVSIIIVNYFSADMVIDCINSIFEKTTGIIYEIIVVDNASTDGSVEKLQNIFGSRIKVIASDQNLGFGRANNLGCQKAQGKYVFLLNPDTVLVNDAIRILYNQLEANPTYGIVGGNLFTADMEPSPSFCMVFDDLEKEKASASLVNIFSNMLSSKLKINNKDLLAMEFNFTNNPIKVAYIFGADMMLPRKLYNEVNGFDPDFFMYGEEEELTWRITNKGYQVICIPDAKIIHLDGATTKKQNMFSPRQFRMRLNGTIMYYYKRYGKKGVEKFCYFRRKRYQNQLRIAKWRGKEAGEKMLITQLECLEKEYQEFYRQLS